MKANELRIGNWIEAYNGLHTVNEIQDLIIWFDVDFEKEKLLEYDYIGIEHLKPISITEDWLVRFGFIEMEDTVPEGYPVFLAPSGTGRIYFSEVTGSYNWAAHELINIENQIEIAKLKYVHQLQNLYFALTAEELIDKT